MAKGAVMAGSEEGALHPEPAPLRSGSRPARTGLPLGLTPRRFVEVAYVALLGFLIVRLVWVVVHPIELPRPSVAAISGPAIDADLSVFSRFDPFGSSGPAEAPRQESYAGAAETTLDLRLVGVSFGGGSSSAVIELPDGRQKSFGLEEEVVGGVTLRDVLPNQAILNRNGLTETLTLQNRDGGAASAGGSRDLPPDRSAPRATPRAKGPLTPGQSLDALSRAFDFEPVFGEDGAQGGFALMAGTEGALFDQSGFVDGDIVQAVDGIAAPRDPERLLELMADLPPGRPFTVTVERDGVSLDVPVDLGFLQ